MHSGLPSADATVTRCSPQRATTRPPPMRCAHGSPPERLQWAWPLLGSFSMLLRHPAEAPQVKDACKVGLLGGGGVGRLPAALRDCGQTGPGGRAPRLPWLAEWSMGPACQSLTKIWSCCAASCASDEAASEPTGGVKARVVAASAPPIGPPRHHHAHPFAFNHQCAQGESWSCTAWQDVLSVCDWLASRRRVRGVAGARVAICVCARCWAAYAWRGSAPEARTGEDAQLASPTKMWMRRHPARTGNLRPPSLRS